MIDAAYAIFLHARSAVTGASYPAHLDYTIDVTGLDGSKPARDRYRAACDPQSGGLRVFPISEEELAAPPPVPRGVNFNFALQLCIAKSGCDAYSDPVGRPQRSPDLLGVPLLEPTYMFGLRYETPVSKNSSPEASALPVIAIVSAQSPMYRVTLLDTPALDGVSTYHLKLTPLRRPKDNRLRELWVGTGDYLPRRAIVSGNFTERPLVDVPWTVDFAVVDGAPYIARESALATLYLEHRRVVHDAVIGFDDVRQPSTIYDRPLIEPEATETATTLVEPSA